MIRELVVYKCTCCKCGKSWATKTHDLPKVCSGCKSVRWNEDHTGGFEMPAPAETSNPFSAPPSAPDGVAEWLERMRAKKGNPPPIMAPAEYMKVDDEWAGWSDERTAAENGDVITYRQHLKTGKVKEIRRESDILATA